GSAWSSARYVLTLATARTCAIHINDIPYGVLEGGKTMRVYLVPGDYTIQASTIGNHPEVYTRRLVVTRQNLNHWRRFTIGL
ncbi:MAG TPA: hypothetical protein VKQ52_08130, partial [Puia sp.]|nr:hypothetical protein [Puia sp.]